MTKPEMCDDCGTEEAIGRFDIVYRKADGEIESTTKGRPLCAEHAKARKVA